MLILHGWNRTCEGEAERDLGVLVDSLTVSNSVRQQLPWQTGRWARFLNQLSLAPPDTIQATQCSGQTLNTARSSGHCDIMDCPGSMGCAEESNEAELRVRGINCSAMI